MPTQFTDLFSALAAQFDAQETRTRAQGGRQVQYITARTAMNRLDSVLGPENWWDEYVPGENSVICRMTIRLPDGSTLTKADAGGYAGMPDQGDDDKSGFSDAFKRAAVKFGVGRYLYRDGVPSYAKEHEPAAAKATPAARGPGRPVDRPPARERGKWGGGDSSRPASAPAKVRGDGDFRRDGGSAGHGQAPPRSGRALFGWLKDQGEHHQVGLLQYIQGWGKVQHFPARLVDWDGPMVQLAVEEAHRKLEALTAVHGEAYEEALTN